MDRVADVTGGEAPIPDKLQVCARWRELRKLHKENLKKLADAPKHD